MNLKKANLLNIDKAAELIRAGKLVAFPTETVYGLGANGLDPIAVAKIFEAKDRPSFNPLILHISNRDQLEEITKFTNPKIELLISEFWPGPLTIVLPKKDIVPGIVTAGHSTVAVRMPNHPVALELIEKSGNPIAAPSANSFSKLSPTKAMHVANQLKDKVDLILDGGNCDVGVESTIIQVDDEDIYLLRPGGLPLENIEAIVGKVIIKPKQKSDSPVAPGMLPFHYAPSIPLKFHDENEIRINRNKNVGVLFFSKPDELINYKVVKVLSNKEDLREAATNLFKMLHEFEEVELDIIYTERIEEVGLGRAIMDRLKRAVKKYED